MVYPGWNMVSVPRMQTDSNAAVIFPGKSGNIFTYNTATKAYNVALQLGNGMGYWAKYTLSDTITIVGAPLDSKTISAAQAGWIQVGSQETTVPISSLIIDGAARVGNAFRYNAATKSYQVASEILPGDAVWLKVSGGCFITIP
jgi:hypothetical protein